MTNAQEKENLIYPIEGIELTEQEIKDIFDSYKFLSSNVDLYINEGETLEQLQDYLQERVDEGCEVIYYANAIKFLSENDPSLAESLEIADEYGLELKSLSSETLATLLNARFCSNELYEFISELENA